MVTVFPKASSIPQRGKPNISNHPSSSLPCPLGWNGHKPARSTGSVVDFTSWWDLSNSERACGAKYTAVSIFLNKSCATVLEVGAMWLKLITSIRSGWCYIVGSEANAFCIQVIHWSVAPKSSTWSWDKCRSKAWDIKWWCLRGLLDEGVLILFDES